MPDGGVTGLYQPIPSQRHLSRLCPGLVALLVLPLPSCSGNHSRTRPRRPEAANIAQLFFLMLVGAVVIWLGLVAFHHLRLSEKAGSTVRKAPVG